MLEAGFPPDEAQRLSALRSLNILDTPAEERFDRITRLTRQLFDVPIVLISLVDADRQWFKSCQGLGVSETPRNISFCGHAIFDNNIFHIPDARLDERFRDNPLVTSAPFIRFYAGAPLKDHKGSRLGTLCIIDDHPRRLSDNEFKLLRDLADWVEHELNVLKLKQSAAALQDMTTLQQAILDTANYSIFSTDARGIIYTFNSTAERWLGYTKDEIIGKTTPVIFHRSDEIEKHAKELSLELDLEMEPGLEVIFAKARRGILDEREWRYVRKDGDDFLVLLSVTSLRDAKGEIKGFLNIARDITERKRAEQMKDEFVSTVSHELRTPLTSIQGSLGLVAGGAAGVLPPKAQGLIAIAHKNSERLVALVNDILDIQKIESGRMDFQFRPLAVDELIDQALEANRHYGIEHGVGLVVEQRVAGAQVLGDLDRLLQVMANLLSNAVKFSPAGETVRVRVERRDGGLRIAVSDRGPGIPEGFRERIFQKFAQADASDTRQKGGTGLGLSIAKAILERHGGRIGFDSRPGQGTTFQLDLPEYQEPGAIRITTDRFNSPIRILHIEDDPITVKIVRAMLGNLAMIDAVGTIKEAKTKLEQTAYGLIILDIVLPDGSGLSLLETLNKDNASPPVLMLSAREHDLGTIEQLSTFLIKSRTDKKQLRNTIEKLTGIQLDPDNSATSKHHK